MPQKQWRDGVTMPSRHKNNGVMAWSRHKQRRDGVITPILACSRQNLYYWIRSKQDLNQSELESRPQCCRSRRGWGAMMRAHIQFRYTPFNVLEYLKIGEKQKRDSISTVCFLWKKVWNAILVQFWRSMARWKAENETIQNGAHHKCWSYSAKPLQAIWIGILEREEYHFPIIILPAGVP